MNIAMVDDLEIDLSTLRQMLTDYLERRHIDYKIFPFSSGRAFLSAYSLERFDAVF